MNKHAHHTIFNRARGCPMAVAETACSQGKGSGESRSRRGHGKYSKPRVI